MPQLTGAGFSLPSRCFSMSVIPVWQLVQPLPAWIERLKSTR